MFSQLSLNQVGILACAIASLQILGEPAIQEKAGVVRVVKGHGASKFEGHVTSVSFSHDGKLAVSADMFGMVKVWEIPSLKEKGAFEASSGPGVKNWAHSAKFSPDDRYVVSGSGDKTVWVWDAASGKTIRRVRGHTEAVRHVFFFPDGNRVLSIDWNGLALAWNLDGDDEPRRIELAAQPNRSLLCSHDAATTKDRRKIVFSSREQTVLYDLEDDRELRTLGSRADALAISPDGLHVAIARDRDRSAPIELCDTTTGQCLWKSPTHYRSAVAFTADGKRLLSISAGDLRLWDVENGDEIGRFAASKDSNVVCIDCSPDGHHALLGTSSGQIILFRLP